MTKPSSIFYFQTIAILCSTVHATVMVQTLSGAIEIRAERNDTNTNRVRVLVAQGKKFVFVLKNYFNCFVIIFL